MYDIAKYIFYILLCLPVLVIGIWFFTRIFGDIMSQGRAEKAERQRKADKEAAARQRQKDIDDSYRRRRGG